MNLLLYCPLCGTGYSRAYPERESWMPEAEKMIPCPCEAEHSRLNREARNQFKCVRCKTGTAGVFRANYLCIGCEPM